MDEQHNRDEEAAESALFRHKEEAKFCCEHCFNVAFRDEVVVAFKRGFSKALAHCRETEVKGLKAENMCDACCGEGRALSGPCMCGGTGKMSDAARHLRIELYKSREQLRVAVEIIEIAKAFVHQDKDNICKECDPEDHKYGWACRFAKALQKIEALKGGPSA